MKILVTGANGFIGKNLVESLKNLKYGKDKTIDLSIEDIYEYDVDDTMEMLNKYTSDCDFVFNLAGVNRPLHEGEFIEGNIDFSKTLLSLLKKHNNKCPIMLSSSIQATLIGRFENSDYGKSKLASEELFFNYALENDVKVLVYRFPNLFGKWCRPNYNSVIATFCYNYANDLPIEVNNLSTELELLYIDDLVLELISSILGKEHYCNFNGLTATEAHTGKYAYVPKSHKATLKEIVSHLNEFKEQPSTLVMPCIPNDSFKKKLYSTYLSYLPKEKVCFKLDMNIDPRGSFTEILKTKGCGQFSVNISKPNITKGEHWHHSKWEMFIVISGIGLIQERNILTEEVMEFKVSGENIKVIHMLPGYTHNIINLSATDELITLMWANESFNKNNPDTFFEKVIE